MEHLVVCQFNEALIRQFRHKAIVVKTDNYWHIPQISEMINRENKLHCIAVSTGEKLSSIQYHREWKNIPIHIFATEMGNFREFLSKLQILRELSIRLFLTSDNKKNISDLQIISSLGVDCGLYFGNQTINWDSINDLMHYNVYGKMRHGTIEPFQYIVTQYQPQQYTDFGSVYFENPQRYVHISDEGKIGLSSNDLKQEKFVTETISELESITENANYQHYKKRWQEFFQQNDGCSYCPSWRVCLGKFDYQRVANPKCAELFSDCMEAAEFYNSKKGEQNTKVLCQM